MGCGSRGAFRSCDGGTAGEGTGVISNMDETELPSVTSNTCRSRVEGLAGDAADVSSRGVETELSCVTASCLRGGDGDGEWTEVGGFAGSTEDFCKLLDARGNSGSLDLDS
jgi:hypothetical protein